MNIKYYDILLKNYNKNYFIHNIPDYNSIDIKINFNGTMSINPNYNIININIGYLFNTELFVHELLHKIYNTWKFNCFYCFFDEFNSIAGNVFSGISYSKKLIINRSIFQIFDSNPNSISEIENLFQHFLMIRLFELLGYDKNKFLGSKDMSCLNEFKNHREINDLFLYKSLILLFLCDKEEFFNEYRSFYEKNINKELYSIYLNFYNEILIIKNSITLENTLNFDFSVIYLAKKKFIINLINFLYDNNIKFVTKSIHLTYK
jgi:hypothetical protein